MLNKKMLRILKILGDIFLQRRLSTHFHSNILQSIPDPYLFMLYIYLGVPWDNHPGTMYWGLPGLPGLRKFH